MSGSPEGMYQRLVEVRDELQQQLDTTWEERPISVDLRLDFQTAQALSRQLQATVAQLEVPQAGPRGPELPANPTQVDVLRLALWRACENLLDLGEHPKPARWHGDHPVRGHHQITDPSELAMYFEQTAMPDLSESSR